MSKPTFVEKYPVIKEEIAKRRGKWKLSALSYLDYDDVSQIILLHIYEKWDKWDGERQLEKWLNSVISNQIKNLIRNNYGNLAPPCNKNAESNNPCSFNIGGDYCAFTPSGKKCSECPLFARWEKSKKVGYNMKLTSSINEEDFVESSTDHAIFEDYFNIEGSIERFHIEMQKSLPPLQSVIYKLIYIENLSDEEVAKIMGYKTTEKNRSAGYKQIHNMKKSILEHASKIMDKREVIFNANI